MSKIHDIKFQPSSFFFTFLPSAQPSQCDIWVRMKVLGLIPGNVLGNQLRVQEEPNTSIDRWRTACINVPQ